MEWTEVVVTVPVEEVDRAGDIAQMVVPYGIYIEDYSHLEQETREIAHIDLIDEELLAKDRSKGLIHIYLEPAENPAEALSFLTERYTAVGIVHEIHTLKVSEEDWASNWKKYFAPLPVGERLLIQPTWETVPENLRGRIPLWIDPGMAFGTGGHATTKLCLTAMERVLKPESTVLDIGCGSGILSMAALLLGASRVVGVDIDALAVKTAVENGRRNHMEPPRYTILQGDLIEQVSGTFDIVVANIVADVICELCQNVRRFLNPGGLFVASGIIDTREADVLEAFNRCGLTVVDRYAEDGWVCLQAEVG